jgi:hypothetical protein
MLLHLLDSVAEQGVGFDESFGVIGEVSEDLLKTPVNVHKDTIVSLNDSVHSDPHLSMVVKAELPKIKKPNTGFLYRVLQSKPLSRRSRLASEASG